VDPKYVVILEFNSPPFVSHVVVNGLHQPLLFFLSLALRMCKINMGLHGNVPINFGILNQHFLQKKLWAKTLPTALFDLQIT
jgi:hypothetical protein